MTTGVDETELCIVCNSPPPSPSTRFDSSKSRDPHSGGKLKLLSEGEEKADLLPQLRVVFLLQQIFKHPLKDESTLQVMRTLGNPSEWFQICGKCSDVVDAGILVFRKRKVKMYKKKFQEVRSKLERKVASSKSGSVGKAKGDANLARNELTEDSRIRMDFRCRVRGEIDATLNCDTNPKCGPDSFPSDLEDHLASGEDDEDEEEQYFSVIPNEGGDPTLSGNEEGFSNSSLSSDDEDDTDISGDDEDGDADFSLSGDKDSDSDRLSGDGDKESDPDEKDDSDKESRNKKAGQSAIREPLESFHEKCANYLDMSLVEYPEYSAQERAIMSKFFKVDRKEEMGSVQSTAFPCPSPSCNVGFLNKFYAIAHIHRVHLEIKKPWRCDQCKCEYSRSLQLRKHLMSHQAGALKVCTICKFSTKFQRTLDTHVVNHQRSVRNPTCSECQESFRFFIDYVRHMHHKHGFEVTQTLDGMALVDSVCEFCSSIFKSARRLEFHKLLRHNEQPSVPFPVCSVCNKTCFRGPLLKRHMKMYHPEGGSQRYFCDQCGKDYKTLESLELHTKFAHVDDPKECRLCGMQERNSVALSMHMHKNHKGHNKKGYTP